MPAQDAIVINRLEFYGFHGASDAEQEIGHRYRIDVRLTVDTRPAGLSDALADTVCYGTAAQRLVEIGTTEQYRLLESLGRRFTETLFAEFPAVQAVWLRIQKIAPPLNAIVASVGIEITRTRTGE